MTLVSGKCALSGEALCQLLSSSGCLNGNPEMIILVEFRTHVACKPKRIYPVNSSKRAYARSSSIKSYEQMTCKCTEILFNGLKCLSIFNHVLQSS